MRGRNLHQFVIFNLHRDKHTPTSRNLLSEMHPEEEKKKKSYSIYSSLVCAGFLRLRDIASTRSLRLESHTC